MPVVTHEKWLMAVCNKVLFSFDKFRLPEDDQLSDVPIWHSIAVRLLTLNAIFFNTEFEHTTFILQLPSVDDDQMLDFLSWASGKGYSKFCPCRHESFQPLCTRPPYSYSAYQRNLPH